LRPMKTNGQLEPAYRLFTPVPEAWAAAYRIGGAPQEERKELVTRRNVPLGGILGVPIGLDYSWFLLFALPTRMPGGSDYPAEFKNWPPLLDWLTGAVTAVMLFVSAPLHELGHPLAALRHKIPARRSTVSAEGSVVSSSIADQILSTS